MNKEYVLIYLLALSFMVTLASGGYLLSEEYKRAEWYKQQYLDAETIIESQSTALDGAQVSLALASGVLDVCTTHLKEVSR